MKPGQIEESFIITDTNKGGLIHELQYDFIIAGAGCAGLSLAMHLIDSGAFKNKRILLVDQDPKKANDRTWCFWDRRPSLFDPIVFKHWDKLSVFSDDFSKEVSIDPYQYKMIRGIDFYEFCLNIIRQQENFTIRTERVEHIFSSELTTGIMVGHEAIHASYVFNSIIFGKPVL